MLQNSRVFYFKIIEWIFFIGLSCLSIILMWNVLDKFSSKKTSFTQYEDKITELPTIVICYLDKKDSVRYQLASDFNIQYVGPGPNILDELFNPTFLKEGKNYLNSSNIFVYLEKINAHLSGRCYKITALSDAIVFAKYFLRIYFNDSIKDLPALKGTIHKLCYQNKYSNRILQKQGITSI